MLGGGRAAITGAVLAGCLGLTGCVGPTVTDASYSTMVAATAEQISSAIASARLAVQLDLNGKAAFQLTDQTVTDAESDADSAAAALLSRQPPDGAALGLYRQTIGPIQSAVDALRTLRIEVRRGDRGAMARALSALDGVARDIDRLRLAAGGK